MTPKPAVEERTLCEHKTKGIASVPLIHPLQSYRCPDCGNPVWFCAGCDRGHRISEEDFTAEWAANGRPEVADRAANAASLPNGAEAVVVGRYLR